MTVRKRHRTMGSMARARETARVHPASAVVDRAARVLSWRSFIRAVGPLVVVIGLFWFAHGTGLLTCPYNAATVDYGAAVVAAGFAIVWLG